MRIIAIVLNFFGLGMLVLGYIAGNLLPDSAESIFIFLVIAIPLCNLVVLFGSKGDNWLALYFRRKALEEKRKIEELNKKTVS